MQNLIFKLTNNDLATVIVIFYVVHCNGQFDGAAFGKPAGILGVPNSNILNIARIANAVTITLYSRVTM